MWKSELATLAADTGLSITVCHFPPATSKWNKIEHRLFSHITMNWRGRPLTSHEVVVNTIAATRTRTGLRVEAALDTGTYPLGIAVSKDRMATLPLEPHPCRGQWNYTLHPVGQVPDHRQSTDQDAVTAAVPGWAVEMLSHPDLTGMSRQDLHTLTESLAPAQAAHTEQRRYQLRGGRRRNAPGAGRAALLTDAVRVLITVIYLRQVCSQKVLVELLGVNSASIGSAIAETRVLLAAHGHPITPTTLNLSTLRALTDFVNTGATARRPHPPETLSHPLLTGMSRHELTRILERLVVGQEAQIERRRYRQRGGPRLPGTRGGVFRQKITDAERILATIYYERGLCTRAALAELFAVSPRTIGNIFLEVRPVLEQDGYVPVPGAARFSTAQALLASIAPLPDTSGDTKPPC